MAQTKNTLQTEIQKVNFYLANEKYKEAYDTVLGLKRSFPGDKRVDKLLHKTEKIIYNANLKSVKNDLKKLKPLWKEQNYKELVETLKKLSQFVPGYKKIEKDLQKAIGKYQQQMIKEREKYKKDTFKQIIKYVKNHEYQKGISLSHEYLKYFPQDERATELLKQVKDSFIDYKIDKNKDLLKSDKYDRIMDFCKDLLTINKNSKKVKKILLNAKRKERSDLEFKKMDFTFASLEHIKILVQKKKFDKAVQALEELLMVDPGNKDARRLLKTSKQKLDKTVDKEMTKKLILLRSKVKNQYKKNKKGFIRL